MLKRCFLILLLLLCSSQAYSDTLLVPVGYSSIQSAIDDANNGDVIIVSTGTYKENLNFLGKSITVTSTDPNASNIVATTIIDGNEPNDPNYGSVVTFDSSEDINSVLTGFTITGGTGSWVEIYWEFKGYLWNRCGGGILCLNGSSPTISKNVFVDNIAGQGGGIYFYNYSNPIIINNTFTNNSAIVEHGFENPDVNDSNNYDHGDGGAIVGFHYCDGTVTGNIIQNNHADYYGGGIHLRQWSNGLISNNSILNNDSALGAGVHITYTSSPTIKGNLIKGNTAGGLGGGGIYIYYYSSPLIEENTITQNESTNGAGIGVYYSSAPVIRNNFIFDNISGAGIRIVGDSVPIIMGNTIVGNTALSNSGGGIDCATNSVPIIENNIIASNGDAYGIYASITPPTIRYNNVWGNGSGNYNSVIGEQTGLNGNISVNPQFVDSNDYHLFYTSPCIDVGDPNFSDANQSDYDGQNRIIGFVVDIGADEVPPIWNISSGGQYETIQSSIDDSNDGNIIIVTPGTYTGDGNRDISFSGKAITLQSINPFDSVIVESTIIDCEDVLGDRHHGFVFTSGEDSNSILTGLTIMNAGGYNDGGGIYCYGSSPTISHCIIKNNTARGHGAGIYCGYDSNPVIDNCYIHSNTFSPSGYGGGIYCFKSSPTITNCTIKNNSAVGYGRHGGGIVCWGDQNASSDAIVANCVISGNTAGHRGGGLYAYWSSPTYINCTVIGNKALEGGGIGSFRESNPAVINCIVRDNIAPEGNQMALISTLRVWGWEEITEMTISYSNVEGGKPEIHVDPNMNVNWGTGNVDFEPNFVNGGYWDDFNSTPLDMNDDKFYPGNYHLKPGSGCVDIGDNSSVPAVSTHDIDGEDRIFNSTVDIGADEMVTNPMDLNNNGIVDYNDLSNIIAEWLDIGLLLETDFYDDDIINLLDLVIFSEEWMWRAGWYE